MRHRANWNHTSEEIESMFITETVDLDWLREIAWQLAKQREIGIKAIEESMKVSNKILEISEESIKISRKHDAMADRIKMKP
jgi:hypothetical protein